MRTFSFILAFAFVLVGPSMAGTVDSSLPGIGTFSYNGTPITSPASPTILVAVLLTQTFIKLRLGPDSRSTRRWSVKSRRRFAVGHGVRPALYFFLIPVRGIRICARVPRR